MKDEDYILEGEVLHVTEKAVLFRVGSDDVWIPTSQIIDGPDEYAVGDVEEITIPEWLAVEKDLI